MDIANSLVKTPEAESETPNRLPATTAVVKQATLTNGVLKRHAPLLHQHHPIVVTYRECLKNHAAAIGGHAVDGCGEFMPSPNSNPAEPTTLKCAACGCHRNFHRREPDVPLPLHAPRALEYQPQNRHHPPPPRDGSPNNSPSPPPISSSYYPSAPQMLMALSHGLSGAPPDAGIPISPPVLSSGNRKRFRTKFTPNQKDRMLEFAEKISWRLQKKDEDEIAEFLNEIGVERGVFKVWMHNNKSTAGKKDPPPPAANGTAADYDTSGAGDITEAHEQETSQLIHPRESTTSQAHGTNGSFSSA